MAVSGQTACVTPRERVSHSLCDYNAAGRIHSLVVVGEGRLHLARPVHGGRPVGRNGRVVGRVLVVRVEGR